MSNDDKAAHLLKLGHGKYIEWQIYDSKRAKRPVIRGARAVLREFNIHHETQVVSDKCSESGQEEVAIGPATLYIQAGVNGVYFEDVWEPKRRKPKPSKAKRKKRRRR